MAKHEHGVGSMMAKASLMACTWTETLKMLEPIGIDRWAYDLVRQYGMRDGLTCSVYWSPKVPSDSCPVGSPQALIRYSRNPCGSSCSLSRVSRPYAWSS
jgi:hypothetical protein